MILIFFYTSEISVRSASAFSKLQRGGDECHGGSNLSGRLLRHRIQKLIPRYDKCLNSRGVYILKNSSTRAVTVPINLFIKFGFVSVNGPRENYFVDALCKFCLDFDSFKPDEIGKW